MKIAQFTNTFTPHVGGVARSVSSLARGLRSRGHEVLVVAPEFPGASESTANVVRMPAYQQFAGGDFSLPSPISFSLMKRLDAFAPDIIHSHHPFLLGGTALNEATARDLPIVYTYHTRYDLYGHYVIQSSDITRRLALGLSIGYCELCDAVIAPSKSIADFIALNGVKTRVAVIPTGVNTVQLDKADTAGLRAEYSIPPNAFVVGHVGRLAVEKNLTYLTEAVIRFLRVAPEAHLIVTGDGERAAPMAAAFAGAGVSDRVHMTGELSGMQLARAYATMDVFAFSSVSDTQGIVLIEAMAAGVPVVALDAPDAREVVVDGENGRLMPGDAGVEAFSEALGWVAARQPAEAEMLRARARKTSSGYSQEDTVQRTLDLYEALIEARPTRPPVENSTWRSVRHRLASQWRTFGRMADLFSDAVLTQERSIDDR